MPKDEISEFFSDPDNRGVASIQDAVELTQLPESRVRAFCRSEGLRRVGATYILDEEDIRDLVAGAADGDEDDVDGDELEPDEDEDGEDELGDDD